MACVLRFQPFPETAGGLLEGHKAKSLLFVLLQDEEEGQGESETSAEVQLAGEEEQSVDLKDAAANGASAEVDAAAEKALPSDDDDLDDEEDEQVITKQGTKHHELCH